MLQDLTEQVHPPQGFLPVQAEGGTQEKRVLLGRVRAQLGRGSTAWDIAGERRSADYSQAAGVSPERG